MLYIYIYCRFAWVLYTFCETSPSSGSGIGGQPMHLGLCEDLGLLTLLQTGSEAGHDELFCTDHLHDLLVTLYAHTLVNNKTTSN